MKIEEKFKELKEKNQAAYMPHIYYGDPNEEFSLQEVKTLVENGADIIEFGIPFSDPTADGPTFQSACERALENGTTPKTCIQGIEKLRDEGIEAPIIITTYYNIPYVFGVRNFMHKIKKAGAQGVIIPNVPIEEGDTLIKAGQETGTDVIFQATPTTSEKRLEKIIEATSGFLYVVNVEGVTGVRDTVPDSTKNLITKIRKYTETPLMAGFGVSKKEHAKALITAGADGIITGSAIGKIYQKNLENPKQTLSNIGKFAKKIKQGANQNN